MTDPIHEAYDNAHHLSRRTFQVTAVFYIPARNWEHAIELAQQEPLDGDWDAVEA